MIRDLFGPTAAPTDDAKTFTVAARKLHETKDAFLVYDGVKKVWLPKQFTTANPDGTFTVPEWLAIEKELL